jgi:hypothetical protein
MKYIRIDTTRGQNAELQDGAYSFQRTSKRKRLRLNIIPHSYVFLTQYRPIHIIVLNDMFYM